MSLIRPAKLGMVRRLACSFVSHSGSVMTALRILAFLATAAWLSGAGAATAVPVVADAVNQNAVAAGDLIFGGNVVPKVEHGWVYTPTTAFDLIGIKTKFGAADGRTVTLEIYDEHPSDGGTLLRTGTFSAVANQFAGAFFAELALEAGEDYFIGFRNLAGLGANTTKEAGAAELPAFFSFKDDGSYDAVDDSEFAERVILQFFADNGLTAVPEPGAFALFGAGLVLTMRRRVKHRRGG
jgi:hypothetical protein